MNIIKKVEDFFAKSGITTENRTISMVFLRKKLLMKFLRFKIDPQLLLKNTFNTNNFSTVISEISIGPAFKTTSYERHNSSDDIIHKYIEKYFEIKKFVDIGVSDGTSALYLIKKIKNIRNASIGLYDKYTHLNLYKRWYGHIYSNQDNEIVYLKIFFLLLYLYPFKLTIKKTGSEIISFDNPSIKELGFNIDYFDVFKSKLTHQANFIKCANILNPTYFSSEKIKLALKNLHRNLTENGYLFIIHNTSNKESLLILRKNTDKLIIEKNIEDDTLLEYIGITDYFKAN